MPLQYCRQNKSTPSRYVFSVSTLLQNSRSCTIHYDFFVIYIPLHNTNTPAWSACHILIRTLLAL